MWELLGVGPQVPGAAPARRVPAAPLGAHGRRRSRLRVLRDRAAAGRRRGARHLRRLRGPLVGGHQPRRDPPGGDRRERRGPGDFRPRRHGGADAGARQARRGASAPRSARARPSSRIAVQDGRATGVVLSTGEEIPARAVVSSADPKRTMLSAWSTRASSTPDFVWRMKNYRAHGRRSRRSTSPSPACPDVLRRRRPFGPNVLAGRIHIGPDIDYLERAYDAAKYGDFSPHPYCDVTIPTLADPSLAPAGKHVMSIVAQFAPYKLKGGRLEEPARRARRRGRRDDRRVRPRASEARREAAGPDAAGSRGDLRRSRAGTSSTASTPSTSSSRCARSSTGRSTGRPVRGLYLCGAGTHPGGGVTGAPGANASRESRAK